MLSHATWQARFGANPAVIGQSMRLSGRPHEIVGVMPPDFKFLWSGIDLWVPGGVHGAGEVGRVSAQQQLEHDRPAQAGRDVDAGAAGARLPSTLGTTSAFRSSARS